MINAVTITDAVKTLLTNALGSNYTITRGQYINMDYEKTPWVGVYKGDLEYDPETLGRGSNSWKAEFEVRIIVQSSNISNDHEKAEDELEGYIKEILDAIMDDKTLGGTVLMTTGVRVTYSYNETNSEDIYFQNAEITLTAEVRTQ